MLSLTHSNVNCQMSIEVCYCCLVQLFETPWTVVHQAPLSMGFSRQEYQGGLPCPPPGERPDPGINPVSPALAGRFFTTESVTRETPGEVRRHQFHLTDWYWYKIKTYCWWRRTTNMMIYEPPPRWYILTICKCINLIHHINKQKRKIIIISTD